MYEMYPDAWAHREEHPPTAEALPRRRARKEHSVRPLVLERQARGDS